MLKWLNKVRELFLPLLELPESRKNPLQETFDIKIEQKEDLEEILNLVKQSIKEEEDRIKTIETKSIVFIGTVGLALSIFSLVSRDILENTFYNNKYVFVLIALMLLILIFYTVVVGWFCIRALETKAYHKINPANYINEVTLDKGRIIKDMLANLEKNKNVINSKADMMIMCQTYYKRILISLPIFILLLGLSILFKDSEEALSRNASYNTTINKTYIDTSKATELLNKPDTSIKGK